MASAAPKPRIPVEKREKIIGLRYMGLIYREIAAKVGCSVGAVCELIKKTPADRHCSGQTHSWQEESHYADRQADRRKTAPQIRACLQEHYSRAVSVSTVQR